MDSDSLLKELIDIIPNMNLKDEEMRENLVTMLQRHKKLATLDEEFIQHLKNVVSIENENVQDETKRVKLYNKKDLSAILDKIEKSVVIYFKSADLYRIYKSSEVLDKLQNAMNTVYKNKHKKYLGPIFEVIPNGTPQKIMILADKSALAHIDKIKGYMVQYMCNKGLDLNITDIDVYESATTVEIVINKFYVANSAERDIIVKDLISFIDEEEKNLTVSNTISHRELPEIKGTQMYLVPDQKKLHGDTKKIPTATDLISFTDKCQQLKIESSGTNVFNFTIVSAEKIKNLNIGTQNIKINNTTNNVKNITKIKTTETVGEFPQYILNNKPKWYKPGVLMDKDILYDRYIELFGNISKKTFTTAFSGKLFESVIRDQYKPGVKRISYVKTFQYSNIKA